MGKNTIKLYDRNKLKFVESIRFVNGSTQMGKKEVKEEIEVKMSSHLSNALGENLLLEVII